MDNKQILTINDLSCKIFRSKQEFSLSPITFTLKNYETIGLVGESGSGKTTLGRLITGALCNIDNDNSGVIVSGKIKYMDRYNYQNSRIRRQLHFPIQMIYQDPKVALNEFMHVREQIKEAAMLGYQKIKTDLSQEEWVAQKVNHLLEILMLKDLENHYPFVMSGGQVRRLGIARVLAVQPNIIIADEPTASLDASTKNMVLDYLVKYTNSRKKKNLPMGSIIISHDLDTISRYSDKILVMKDGNLIELMTKDKNYNFNPKEDFTKKLWNDNAFFSRQ